MQQFSADGVIEAETDAAGRDAGALFTCRGNGNSMHYPFK